MPSILPKQEKAYLITAQDSPVDINLDWFKPSHWQAQKKITGHSAGRNITYFFQENKTQYVLRHYYRGGLIGKILTDAYVFLGLKNTRVYREFALLEEMQRLNLPVPIPVAAKISQNFHLYRADIIMQQIPHAQDLSQRLLTDILTDNDWQTIGTTLAKFHNAGIYHADLNIHNIMIDDEKKVWLIDFDRGQKKKIATQWQQANMSRLLRSFNKEKMKNSQLNWNEQAWLTLESAYFNALVAT
ncbi:3-deoxy-D-manno-octulosonic acid kinase [Algibacillus agarilyticus]|uniref:3-deoxy-D-manno-octulosonic acid kinase n=1 Tax=Algibacillus agarilyticus TaxID=2234133 RepID=UPI000DD0D468|nr:3-deoxy-D-manno-octulosonic acid kinase [Algibacillus agarilyticus]